MLATSTSEKAASPCEPCVYVVDDEQALRKSLRWLMESVGLKVETFGSAQEFLMAYKPTFVGCLLLDVRMPVMSGLELQERLREKGCRMPVIIMTAHGDVPTAVRAMKSGAVQFFEKPVSDQVLLDHIHQQLASDVKRYNAEMLQRDTLAKYQRLTNREAEVLDEVVAGFSSKEIGGHLRVSFKTIEAHRAKIMRKMEADSVPHLIRMYLSLPAELRVPGGRDDSDVVEEFI